VFFFRGGSVIVRDEPFAALEEAAARQSAEDSAGRAIATARAQLILGRDAKSAFFATLALRLAIKPDWSVPTLATDGRELLFNPGFVNSLGPLLIQGVLVHEVMHNALAHPARRGHRDPTLWNVACDLAINPILREAGMVLPSCRLMPGEGQFAELTAGRSAEEYYATLRRGSDESDDAENDVSPGTDPGGCGQVVDPDQGDSAAARSSEDEWKIAIVQAEQATVGRGDLPAGLARLVREVLHPPLDWRAVLREFLSSQARNDYSWARPNRRFLAQGLYLPGLHSEELGDVVLAVDTSGSIGETILGVFASEANAVLSAYDCSVTVLYHDSQVQKVQGWQSSDGPLVLDPVGGGGTSHVCVFDWLEQSGLVAACVICLTDLETEFPTVPPGLPVLWAVVGGRVHQAPFGQVVPLIC
jgi:predicted metal-dependent peptidase